MLLRHFIRVRDFILAWNPRIRVHVETGGREKRLKPTGEKIYTVKSTRRPRGAPSPRALRGIYSG